MLQAQYPYTPRILFCVIVFAVRADDDNGGDDDDNDDDEDK